MLKGEFRLHTYVYTLLQEISLVNTTESVHNQVPETQVRYAYFIEAAYLIVHCFLIFGLYLTGDRTCCTKEKQQERQAKHGFVSTNRKGFTATFLTLMFVFFWMYCGLEINYGIYLTTYTVDQLNWSKTSGALLTSVFWGSFTFGRGMGILIVRCLSASKLVLGASLMVIISLIPEVFFSHSHYIIMWISTVLLGLFMSCIYASGFTFANMYVNMTGGLGALMVAAGSLGSLTGPAIVTPLFSTYGMKVFEGMIFAMAAVMFISLLLSWLVGTRWGQVSENGEASETSHLLQGDPQGENSDCSVGTGRPQ